MKKYKKKIVKNSAIYFTISSKLASIYLNRPTLFVL